jgi:hypothetical protein
MDLLHVFLTKRSQKTNIKKNVKNKNLSFPGAHCAGRWIQSSVSPALSSAVFKLL